MKRFGLNDESQMDSVNAFTRKIQARIQALPQLKTQDVRAVRREFSKRLASTDPDLVLKLALNLRKFSGFEFHFIAYELVQHHHETASSLDAAALEKLGNGMNGWAAVDCFACYLAGPAWRKRQISDSVVRRWSRSSDCWWRRAALVATVPLNNKTRGGAGDSTRTLDICHLLVNDREPMVIKALSWALRELAKRDAPSVREFLRKERDKLAAQVVREVENKLATGLKNPRKAQKR
jgi:3-methyladenine DNA glycosylase AlkD